MTGVMKLALRATIKYMFIAAFLLPQYALAPDTVEVDWLAPETQERATPKGDPNLRTTMFRQ